MEHPMEVRCQKVNVSQFEANWYYTPSFGIENENENENAPKYSMYALNRVRFQIVFPQNLPKALLRIDWLNTLK